ncbi:hypothetical protein EDC04DRAFT_2632896 [Pisolithus marmoratus]|nr:hypothetical protein EDC04DRAFT_2632896 [Pisolithus marmoratus]
MVILPVTGYLVMPFPWLCAHPLWRYEFSQWTEGYETVWQISREQVRLFSPFLVLPTLLVPLYYLAKFHRIAPSSSSPMPCHPPSPYLA